MAEIFCFDCGNKLRVTEDLFGKRARCPVCGNVLAVPHLRSAAPPELPADPAGTDDLDALASCVREARSARSDATEPTAARRNTRWQRALPGRRAGARAAPAMRSPFLAVMLSVLAGVGGLLFALFLADVAIFREAPAHSFAAVRDPRAPGPAPADAAPAAGPTQSQTPGQSDQPRDPRAKPVESRLPKDFRAQDDLRLLIRAPLTPIPWHRG